MSDNFQNHADSYHDTLLQLLAEVQNLCADVTADVALRLARYKPYYRAGVFNKSALNLAH